MVSPEKTYMVVGEMALGVVMALIAFVKGRRREHK
jgi:hypothetical protein